MDQRATFDSLQKLKTHLQHLQQHKEKASLLVDVEGLTRMEGFIRAVEDQADLNSTSIILDQGNRVLLEQIIAVNGQFRSDYSEC